VSILGEWRSLRQWKSWGEFFLLMGGISILSQLLFKMREALDPVWLKLLQDATSFADKHDISSVFKQKRVKKVKRMPGELAQDQPIDDRMHGDYGHPH